MNGTLKSPHSEPIQFLFITIVARDELSESAHLLRATACNQKAQFGTRGLVFRSQLCQCLAVCPRECHSRSLRLQVPIAQR